MRKHLYVSAIFFADQLVSLQGPQPEEIYTLAECYFKNREYRPLSSLGLIRFFEVLSMDSWLYYIYYCSSVLAPSSRARSP